MAADGSIRYDLSVDMSGMYRSLSQGEARASTSGARTGQAFNASFTGSLRNLDAAVTNPVNRGMTSLRGSTSRFSSLGGDFGRAMSSSLGSALASGNSRASAAMFSIWNAGMMKVADMISATLQGAITTVKGLVSDVVRVGMAAEKTKATFSTLTGSKEKGSDLFNKGEAFAKATPFDNQQSFDAIQQMLALEKYRKNTDLMIRDLTAVGNVAAGTGKSLAQVAYVYTQTQVQGRAMAEDLNQFANAGVPIYEALAKAMGQPVDAVKKLASDGKVTSEVITKAFMEMTASGGTFSGAMAGLAKTTEGRFNELTSSLDGLKGQIFAGLVEPLGVLFDALNGQLGSLIAKKELVNGLTKVFGEMAVLVDKNKVAIASFIKEGLEKAQGALLAMANQASAFMKYLTTPEGKQAIVEMGTSLQGIGVTLGQLGQLTLTLIKWYIAADNAVIKWTASMNKSSAEAHAGMVRFGKSITDAISFVIKLGQAIGTELKKAIGDIAALSVSVWRTFSTAATSAINSALAIAPTLRIS